MFKKIKKKHIILASLLMGIFSLFMFCTIAYSAINSTMRISGNAYTRVEADVRITDFRLAAANNATSSFEDFGKNHIVTEIDLIDSTSSISYYVEITNYGASPVGIYDITGLPEGVYYYFDVSPEEEDYVPSYYLMDKLCDENNVCSGFFKRTIKITFETSTSFSDSIRLEFEFRPFFNISYVGFSSQPDFTEFIAGADMSIDLTEEYPEFVYATGVDEFNFKYEDGFLYFKDVWCDVEVGVLSGADFSYSGGSQTYKVKADGVYKVELWGASGGDGLADGQIVDGVPGYGSYTSGLINFNKGQELYVYTGGRGSDGIVGSDVAGGYNGGGTGCWDEKDDESGSAGGGATDIRLVGGNWNDFNSLKSRIMVAAGGGGYVWRTRAYESSGGGLTTNCYGNKLYFWDSSEEWDYWTCKTPDTTQTSGYMFGIGKNGEGSGLYNDGSPGAGGGYYGGTVSYQTSGFDISVGGSSFISWHDGCDAITDGSTSSNIVHTGQSIHYSGSVFSNTVMIDGMGYKWTNKRSGSVVGMPNFAGNGTMVGNVGNGYAKITPVAIGDYNLVKFNGTDEDLSNYSYVLNGNSLVVNLNKYYSKIVVKTKDGNEYNNFTYDVVGKKIVLNNVTEDIEVTMIGSVDVSSTISSSGSSIYVQLDISNVCFDCYPITAEIYYKLSSDDDSKYKLYDSHTFTDTTRYYKYFNDTAEFSSYDVKIVVTADNSYTKTIIDSVGTECFLAGTKVLTENGLIGIENIKLGDYVYSINVDNNEKELKKVINVFNGSTDETFELYVGDQIIKVTPKHKFYVIDKGWIRACELEVGDMLNGFTNGNIVIDKIVHKKHDIPLNVYNLTVEGYHNYLVTEYQLLVHNSGSK